MGVENHAEWLRAIHDPDVVRGMLEDYRAGLTVDRAAEAEHRSAGRRVEAPSWCCGRCATISNSSMVTR